MSSRMYSPLRRARSPKRIIADASIRRNFRTAFGRGFPARERFGRAAVIGAEWLGEEDSNLRTQIQSLVSCR